jgi:hypothetical protein
MRKMKYRPGGESDGEMSMLESSFSSFNITPRSPGSLLQSTQIVDSGPSLAPLESPQLLNQVETKMQTSYKVNGSPFTPDVSSREESVAYSQLVSGSPGGHNGYSQHDSSSTSMSSHQYQQRSLDTFNRPNFNYTPKPFEPYQSQPLERQNSFKREPDSPSGIVEQPLLNVLKGKSMFESTSATTSNSSSSFFQKSEDRSFARQ